MGYCRTRFLAIFTAVLELAVVAPFAHAHPLISGFTRIPLGYTVSAWYPVDINNDSLWELAITCSGTPTRIGIFSPKTKEWLDGPYPVPAAGRNWGVGDYDGDGISEYAYLKFDTIRLADPRLGLDSVLWVAPFAPEEAIFWGKSETGAPLVGLKQGIYYDRLDCTYELDFDCLVEHSEEWKIHVFELLDGTEREQVPGGHSAWKVFSATPGPEGDRLMLHYHEYYSLDFLLVHSRSHTDTILSVDPSWSCERAMGFVTPQRDSIGIPTSPRYVARMAAIRAGTPPSLFMIADLCHVLGPPPFGDLYNRNLDQHSTAWRSSHYWANDYTDFAAFDLHEDGHPALYLPLVSGQGWEVRTLSTGAITDTIPGMPKADLQTGPLTVAGHQDLFYIADSGLYIWGLPIAVNEGQTPTTSLPTSPWLTAHPNPFNGSVRLDWSPGAGATTLDIFNILGQRIRSYHLVAASSSRTSLEWDAKDQTGGGVPSGIYCARLTGGSETVMKKLVLLK